MPKRNSVRLIAGVALVTFLSCASPALEPTELCHFPLDDMTGIITRSHLQIDPEISADGNGSLQITASTPTVVRLFELGDLDVEDARLIYRARMRTEGVDGRVYLELLCHFPGRGEFFSRSLQTPLSGTCNWTTEETPFFLQKGENPDNIRLNLVIEGTGTAWIDDIHLLKGPLRL